MKEIKFEATNAQLAAADAQIERLELERHNARIALGKARNALRTVRPVVAENLDLGLNAMVEEALRYVEGAL